MYKDIETKPENAATQPESTIGKPANKPVDVVALVNLDLDAKPSAQVSKTTPVKASKQAPKQASKSAPQEDSQAASNIEVKLSVAGHRGSTGLYPRGRSCRPGRDGTADQYPQCYWLRYRSYPDELVEWPPYPNAPVMRQK